VYTEEIPALVGCARRNQLGIVWEQRLQVFKVLHVLVICMVRVEPCKIVGLSLPSAFQSGLCEDGLPKIFMEDGTPQLEGFELCEFLGWDDNIEMAANSLFLPRLQRYAGKSPQHLTRPAVCPDSEHPMAVVLPVVGLCMAQCDRAKA